MSNNRKRLQVYLEPEEYRQLKEWSQDTGKSMSQLARQGILEYTDHDRHARQDEKLDEILAAVRSLSEQSNTHTQTPRSNSVPAKARQVARTITENHGTVLKDDDVELTIENVADVGDDRSIRKYKRQLKKRGLLFEHPGDPPTWTTESDTFEDWLANYAQLNGREAAEDIADDYPVRITRTTDDTLYIEVQS